MILRFRMVQNRRLVENALLTVRHALGLRETYSFYYDRK
jgi:hypothetical protein